MNNMESKPSPDNIKMARFIADAIGFDPHVYPYYDDNKENKISILSLTDPIDSNMSIHSTIGLSDYENVVGGENIPVELMGATYKKFDKAANIISTCGFYIMKDKFECRPGNVFKWMVEHYFKNIDMKHIYFSRPFLWQEKLEQLHLDTKNVHFLFCIPISDKELEYKEEKGDSAMEYLLQSRRIDFYDLNRRSTI